MQLLGRIPAISTEAPYERPHRCNDFCRTACDFCFRWLCRDGDTYEVMRVGDDSDFVRRCEECQEKHASGKLEEAV